MNQQEKYGTLLERCATPPFAGSADKWRELLGTLGLPVCDAYLVLGILLQPGWRKAVDPIQYIRVAVRKEKSRQERAGRGLCISDLNLPRAEDGASMGHDDAIEYLTSRSFDDSWETPYVELKVRREFRGGDSWDEDAQYTLNYSKLMGKVALEPDLTRPQRDAIEEVLRLRGRSGLTREQIMACPPAERRRLQAAWRWIDRNKTLLAKLLSNRP